MHKRKITKEGRVNIPVEILDIFNLKEDEYVEVSTDRQYIRIRKWPEKHVCAVTGKVSKTLTKVGEMYISNEGFRLLQEQMEKGKQKDT